MEPTTTTTTSSTSAPAGTVPGQEAPSVVGMLMPFILIFVVFYFLILRPQQKKVKEHQAMVAAVRRGDKVITAGGIFGKVSKVNAETGTVTVEIAKDVEVDVIASSISNVINAKPINDNDKTVKTDKKKKK